MEALILIASDFKKYGYEFKEDFVLVKIKNALEVVLFGREIKEMGSIEEYIRYIESIDNEIGVVFKERLI